MENREVEVYFDFLLLVFLFNCEVRDVFEELDFVLLVKSFVGDIEFVY